MNKYELTNKEYLKTVMNSDSNSIGGKIHFDLDYETECISDSNEIELFSIDRRTYSEIMIGEKDEHENSLSWIYSLNQSPIKISLLVINKFAGYESPPWDDGHNADKEMTESAKNLFTYDSKGRLSSLTTIKYRVSWQEYTSTPIPEKTEFTYDDDDQLILTESNSNITIADPFDEDGGYIIGFRYKIDKDSSEAQRQYALTESLRQYALAAVIRHEAVFESIEWVNIPAGSFLMGSPEDEWGRDSNEEPQRTIEISAFKMSAHCITFDQYDAFCEATNRSRAWHAGWGAGQRPVINVSWEDAIAFAEWLGHGVRLPTEAEWEYACRAGTTTAFNTGDTINTDQANYDGKLPYGTNPKGVYRKQTLPVGSFSPNAWGLYDMHGNVREMCSDWYIPGYRLEGSVKDPKGPSRGRGAVVRGGFYNAAAKECRSASRDWRHFYESYAYVGFRLVYSTEE